MSTTRPDAQADPDALAERLASATLVKLVPRVDGDAIAAAGTVARALQQADVPFQISPARTRTDRRNRIETATDAVVVAVGALDGADATISADGTTVSETAASVAGSIGEIDEPELPLAGIIAGGGTPGAVPTLLERAKARGLERQPGIATPVADLADGLAHSTLVHTPVSGDRQRARELLDTIGITADAPEESALRTVASLAAIDGTDTDSPKRAAETIGRFVSPYVTPEGPFETLGGYADVIDAAARHAPGTAVALAIGGNVREPALSAWREHAVAVHDGLRNASTGRYDGFVVLRVDDGPPAAIARRYRDIATAEPVVVGIGPSSIGVATTEKAATAGPLAAVSDAVDGTADWSHRSGFVAAGGEIDERTVIDAVRGAV